MNHTFKIEQLLSTAAEFGFTRHDFADLARVAAKRSGAVVAELAVVAGALGIETAERDRGFKDAHFGGAAWGELPTKRRQAVIADRVRYAKRIGILSEAGEPRSVQ